MFHVLRFHPVGPASRISPCLRGVFAFVCLFSTFSLTLKLHAESLSEAALETFANNPGRKAARMDVEAATAGVAQARAGYWPTVNLSSQYGWLDQRIDPVTGGPQQKRFTHPRGFGVQLNQTLWNGFKTSSNVDRELENLKSANEQVRSSDQSILLDVISAYLDVVRQQEAVKLYQSNGARDAFALAEVSARLTNGLATGIDRDQSAAAAAGSNSDFVVAEAKLSAAQSRYAAIVGHLPGQVSLPLLPVSLLPASREEALDRARQHHPDLLSAEYAANSARANLNAAKADYMPTVELQAQVERDFQPSSSSSTNRSLSLGAMLVMNFPIFQGGLTTATVNRANAQFEKQVLQLDNQRQKLQGSVTAAFEQFKSNRKIVDAARARLNSANRALESMKQGVAVGQSDASAVHNARAAAGEARFALINAQCNQVFDAYNLLATIGELKVDALGQAGETSLNLAANAPASAKTRAAHAVNAATGNRAGNKIMMRGTFSSEPGQTGAIKTASQKSRDPEIPKKSTPPARQVNTLFADAQFRPSQQ